MVVHAHYPIGETRVEREARALVDSGYAVDVICLRSGSEPAEAIQDGITVYRLPVKRHKRRGAGVQLLEYLAFFVLASFKLAALHWRRHYTVVQVHNLPDFLIFAALAPKLGGARLILDLHDLMPEFYQSRFGQARNSIAMRLVRLQERLSCRFADHVITVSEHWRQALIKRGVPPEKCSVVMNLADPRIFNSLSAQYVSPRDADSFRLFYHGSLPERYGLDLVLQAMDRVRGRIPAVHLTIVGYGEHLQILEHIAEELGLKGRQVEFRATVPVEQLPSLITAVDLGVVPYRADAFTDSLLPTKLMEYAAMGLPCIVARTSAISAYFDETMVAFFTPNDVDDLAHCILTLYSDRGRLAELARGIQKFNLRHNWPAESADYVHLVDRLAH
jgi:glycosyltransferase involved in cell wall biosynthesis